MCQLRVALTRPASQVQTSCAAASEVMSLAELYLGLSPCETDPAAMKSVYTLLEKQAPSVKVYSSDGIIDREAFELERG